MSRIVNGHRLPDEVDEGAPNRREFLSALGLGIASAALAACTRAPDERIVPYVHQPPEVTPGVASFYATAIVEDGYATGLLAESHEGRPTKIEGNPRHPSSLGATSAIHQAWVLQLYDPNRARGIEQSGRPASRRALEEHLGKQREAARATRGRNVHLLLSPTSSPLMLARLDHLRAALPEVHVWYEPGASPVNAWEGARRAFGKVLEVDADLSKAEVIVAIDSDPLARGPLSLRDARRFGQRRRLRSPDETPPRLWAIEPALTCTGIAADDRVRLRASDIGPFVIALLADVLDAMPDAKVPAEVRSAIAGVLRTKDDRRARLVHDLLAHKEKSALIVGPSQPPEVHAVVHAIHAALGAIGPTITLRPSPIAEAGGPSFAHAPLLSALDGNAVDLLLVSGANPAYDAPVDEDFTRRMRKAKSSVVHALHAHETAREASWIVPARHGLETWGDARAADGTLGIVQPLIAPLFNGLSDTELVAMLAGDPRVEDHEALMALHAGEEGAWERALQAGIMDGTAIAPLPPTLDGGAVAAAMGAIKPAPAGLEIGFPLDAKVHDGRFANVAWLQELPDPITKLTWRNAARISTATAKRLGLSTNDEVDLVLHDRSVRSTIVVSPGDADDVITLSRGWGRKGAEDLARDRGSCASHLRTAVAPHYDVGVAVRAIGTQYRLAITQEHVQLHGRELIAVHRSRAEWKKEPDFAADLRKPQPTLYKLPIVGSPLHNQWGMVIDLAACTGCSACVVACQAENNIPTVGEEAVRERREMHWLRIDRYYLGDSNVDGEPRAIVQPMLCQHCEKAPCEYVCPVNATVHSEDGLNEQLYQRCVGTRFCSNNCPYKVRRFNWFRFHHPSETEKMVFNPDVTVRGRGVMEKCSFCVQRIREAEISCRTENRPYKDGDVKTACQQACPTGAIVFGSIADPKSGVSVARANPRQYAALDESAGTEPRVRYLAKISDSSEEKA